MTMRLCVSLVLAFISTAFGGEIRWRSAATTDLLSTGSVAGVLGAAREAGERHVVLQFAKPLSAAERVRLAQAGVNLLSWLGDGGYFGSLDTAVNSEQLLGTPSLVSLRRIAPIQKLHPMLARGETPEWAVVPPPSGEPTLTETWIAVYILFHADVTMDDARMISIANRGLIASELPPIRGQVLELPLRAVDALAADDAVMYVEPALPPMMETNDSNRNITGANIVQAAPYNLDGTGVTVMVYDGGYAYASHLDFQGRLTVRDSSGLSTHATHVCGTIGGAGVANPTYRGMAPGVTIESYGFEQVGGLHQGFLYTDPGDLLADYSNAINSHGADIANNSIGTNTAPNGFPCTWEGDYGVTSALIDTIVRGGASNDGSPFRIVWANGNERSSGRCGTTYHTTAPPACAKNHITVGALNSNDDSVTYFTSWGPADDGRMKPDVSAPGCQVGGDSGVTSCSTGGPSSYITYCGTSMASPTVCGLSALIMQDYRDQFPTSPDPRNSTLKILLAHNAQDIQAPGPDYQTGYGSVRIQRTIDFLRTGNFFEDQVDQDGIVRVLTIIGAADTELKVTVAWDDPSGTPNVDPALVNDLDIVVLDPAGGQHYPWTLGGLANPSAPAVRTQADHVNNIEQVYVEAPTPGVWTIEIHGYSVPMGPQPFSAAITPGFSGDCNGNGVNDFDDIANGTSEDCDSNGVPDECQSTEDCNANGSPDFCDLFGGTSNDVNSNGIPDECEPDCNGNGIPDAWDISTGASQDCNGNESPDECDIASGASIDCNDNDIPDECEVDCNGNGIADSCDIAQGTSPDCNGNLIPDECEPDCNLNGVPDDCDIASGFSDDANGDGFPDECDTLFVDPNAVGDNNGASWAHAYTSLYEALAHANSNAGIVGVWVARGTYSPPNGGGGADATFTIRSGLHVYGGFAGGEGNVAQRDPAAHPTILDGQDASFHVVTLTGTAAGTLLDGFTIERGSTDTGSGGGLLITGGEPIISNCTVYDNRARLGAGVCASNASPTFENCVFDSNHTAPSGEGGAIYASASSGSNAHLTLTDCTFIANSAYQSSSITGHGGAVRHVGDSSLSVDGCFFEANYAWHNNSTGNDTTGGAISDTGTGTDIRNSIFLSSYANAGAGVYTSAPMTVVNCVFADGRAVDVAETAPGTIAGRAGAIYSAGSTLTLRSSTITDNDAQKMGGGVVGGSGSVADCVIWGNTVSLPPGEDPIFPIRIQIDSNASFSYSDVEGVFDTIPGEDPPNPADFPGCIDADPLFVDALADDYRLDAGSPCIDAGANGSVPAGVTTDLDGSPRFADDPPTPDTGSGTPPIVDIGAYEFGSTPPECTGDLNGDGVVNLADLATLLANFGTTSGAQPEDGDIDGDGDVDLADLGVMLAVFGSACP